MTKIKRNRINYYAHSTKKHWFYLYTMNREMQIRNKFREIQFKCFFCSSIWLVCYFSFSFWWPAIKCKIGFSSRVSGMGINLNHAYKHFTIFWIITIYRSTHYANSQFELRSGKFNSGGGTDQIYKSIRTYD